MKTYQVLDLFVSSLSYHDTKMEILAKAKQKVPSYFCFANVHMTIEAYDNKEFAKQVNRANLVCADGMPLVKAIQLNYAEQIERVAGMDMMPTLLQEAAKQNIPVYFFGSTNEVLKKIVAKAKSDFSNLKVAGFYSPPFRKLSEEEEKEIALKIQESEAQLVFVALGCPKQEKWMARNSKRIHAPLLGVGGAFPVYIQQQKRAPEWVRNMSLEWFYRFMQDPKRLFKRYFYTNTKFLFLFFGQLIFKAKK